MNRAQVDEAVMAMLAAETGCSPAQLTDGATHVVARKPDNRLLPEHRRFNPHPGRTSIVTLGVGAVVSVERDRLDEARHLFAGLERDQTFLPETLRSFATLQSPGLTLYGPGPRFTCASPELRRVFMPPPYELKILDIEAEDAANGHVIDRSQFPHALFPRPGESGRPTALAAVALKDGEIAGIAGVTRDSDFLWQIGIDVLPGHQGTGLAAALTSSVAQAAFDAGAIPYYGTTNSNIRSQRTALSVGFRLAWVEVFTRPA